MQAYLGNQTVAEKAMSRLYLPGCILLSLFGAWACKLDCSKLPDNRPVRVLAIPIRVADEPAPSCVSQEAFISVLQERLRQCESPRNDEYY